MTTWKCGKCLHVSKLARQFVAYAVEQDMRLQSTHPDIDLKDIKARICSYHGVSQPDNDYDRAAYRKQATYVASLVHFAMSIEDCRFASHLEPVPDACLVHGILGWDEAHVLEGLDTIMRHLIDIRLRR